MKPGLIVALTIAVLAYNPAARAQASNEAPVAAPAKPVKTTDLPYAKKSPWIAGALSVVPGLGQMYNEDYLVGGLALGVEIGLYMAAASYAGLFDANKAKTANFESIFLVALAGGIHLLCIFDATLEASRRNENLRNWSVSLGPGAENFQVGYRFWF